MSELTISAERMAGTACGGMDQTISIMGQRGTAKLIDFVPCIKTTPVKIPDSVCLVIGNSCTPVPKLATLGTRYNKRVVECRWATAALAMAAGVCENFNECKYSTFEKLQSDLKYSLEQMVELCE
jgi:galactokinase